MQQGAALRLPSAAMRPATSADDVTGTRTAYDAVAEDYARLLPDVSLEAPLDRAVLAAFAEMLRGQGDPLVVDVGCGAGRVARHLADAGLRLLGVDLSPAMVGVARLLHAGLPFAAGQAGALPLRTGTAGGLLAWYSLIHLPTEALAEVFAEFARVARPGALVLVAFQAGQGQRVDPTTSYEQPVPLSYYRHDADQVAAALERAGFALCARVQRAAALSFESTPQAALLGQRH